MHKQLLIVAEIVYYGQIKTSLAQTVIFIKNFPTTELKVKKTRE